MINNKIHWNYVFNGGESDSGAMVVVVVVCWSWAVSFVPMHHGLSYVTSTAGKQSVNAAMEINATERSVDTGSKQPVLEMTNN